MMSDDFEVQIEVVDEECPSCGGHGHPDREGFYGNSPEVCDEDGTWWWECNNNDCEVDMFNPEKEMVEIVGEGHIPYDSLD